MENIRERGSGNALHGAPEGSDGGSAAVLAAPDAQRWRLADIFGSAAEWESAADSVAASLAGFAAYQGRLGDPARCAACLTAFQDTASSLHRVAVYTLLERDLDLRAGAPRTRFARAEQLEADFGKATAFIRPELLALPPERWHALRSAEGVRPFGRFLDEIARLREHVLTTPEEAVLAELSPAFGAASEIFTAFNSADLHLPEVVGREGPIRLTLGNYQSLLQSRDRELRRQAFFGLHETYRGQRHTLATALGAAVKQAVCLARARRYPNSLTAALDPDEIPTTVYDSLVTAVRSGLPALQRYLRLRREALGLDALHLYDLGVPLTDVDLRISYPEAAQLVREALAPLGPAYGAVLGAGLAAERWVDVPETSGKRPGAYSCGVFGVHPFILLNFGGTLGDAFTLAHELGHSLHSHLSNRRQPYLTSEYSLFVAEVASTVNEVLLARHLMRARPDLAAWATERLLDTFRTTVFRQTHFAEFERAVHAEVEAGRALSADGCDALYADLVRAYYEPETAVDDVVAAEWSRIPHFYRPFYVYQYATGLSAATAVADLLLADGQPGLERYLDFLSAGGSAGPVDLLRRMGVDVTTAEPVEQAIRAFARDTARLAEYLGSTV